LKIGNFEVRSPFKQLREQALDADHAQGLFRSTNQVIYKTKDLVNLYDLYENHDMIRGMVDDLAEAATGNGYYNSVKIETAKLKKSKPRDLVDEFGEKFNLDEMLPKIAKNNLIAGFCPVETKLMADIEKCSLKIVHPKTIDDIIADPLTGEVTRVHQKVGSEQKWLEGVNLAWFSYGALANDPRGLSYVKSVAQLLGILDTATNSVSTIVDRYTSPIAVWKSRQPSAVLKKAVTDHVPGEDIFVGNLTPEELTQKIVEWVTVDPRVPFWEFIDSIQTRIYSYSRASNIWYTKNANLASAEVMEDIVARHVNAIQRNIKRSVEKYWYAPLIKLNSYEETPRLNFGKEPTGVEDITPSDIINTGMQLGYITQKQFYEILKQCGIKISEELEEDGLDKEKPENATEQPKDEQDKDGEVIGKTEQPPVTKEGQRIVNAIETVIKKEAMPNFESPVKAKMRFTARIDGDKITGELVDAEHYYSATKFTTKEVPLDKEEPK
jgi:hypothetical protein